MKTDYPNVAAVRRVPVGATSTDVLEHVGDWRGERVLCFGCDGADTVQVKVTEHVDGRVVRSAYYTLAPGGYDVVAVSGSVVVSAVCVSSTAGPASVVWAHFLDGGEVAAGPNVDARISLPPVGGAGAYTLVGYLPPRRHWLSIYVDGPVHVAWGDPSGVPFVPWPIAAAGALSPLVHPPALGLWARNPAAGPGPDVHLVAAWSS